MTTMTRAQARAAQSGDHGSGLGWAVRDTLAMAGRNLRRCWVSPSS